MRNIDGRGRNPQGKGIDWKTNYGANEGNVLDGTHPVWKGRVTRQKSDRWHRDRLATCGKEVSPQLLATHIRLARFLRAWSVSRCEQRLLPEYCVTSRLGETFNVTGLRVPLIVVSPYAKPNFISHIPRDCTAIVAYIESTFAVPPLTARDSYRQDPSRDFNEFFDFSTPALLTGPGGTPGAQILKSQTATGVCDNTKEAGPTM